MIIENLTESITGVRNSKGIVFTFMPGGNQITKEAYESVKAEVDYLVGKKALKVHAGLKDTKDGKEKSAVEDLIGLSAEEAEKLVAVTVDMKTLKAWKGKETRDAVRLAIQKRMDEITENKNSGKE